MIIGVSPAYFLSKFGEHFSPTQVMGEIPILKGMGFDCFQLEITHREHLADWDERQLELLHETCSRNDVHVSQLVAHFWIDNSSDSLRVLRGYPLAEVHKLLDLASRLPGCDVLTVPFGKFRLQENSILTKAIFHQIEDRLVDWMRLLCDMAQGRNLRIALELQPEAIIAGIGGMRQMLARLPSVDNLGYNFDTGHAHAFRDVLETIPSRLGSKIFGTHLCDNDGMSNLSLTPGDGTIEWVQVLRSLQSNDYHGSFDLEIICPPEQIPENYSKGRQLVLRIMQ